MKQIPSNIESGNLDLLWKYIEEGKKLLTETDDKQAYIKFLTSMKEQVKKIDDQIKITGCFEQLKNKKFEEVYSLVDKFKLRFTLSQQPLVVESVRDALVKMQGMKKATGKISWDDGSYYDGDLVDGIPNGNGVLTLPNGVVYQGKFLNNQKHGEGVFTYKTGQIYRGIFEKDQFHGKGTFTFNKGNYEGNFEGGLPIDIEGTIKYKDGKVYKGEVELIKNKRGYQVIVPSGQGEMKYPTISIFEKYFVPAYFSVTMETGLDSYRGEFKQGDMHGHGTLTSKSKRWIYEGDFKYDQKSGNGTKVWDNGTKFEGKWINDVWIEKGKFIWPNGNTYEGTFKENELTGNGAYTWKNGDTYTGDFQNWQWTGNGIYKWTDGDTYQGRFLKGTPIGKGTYTWKEGEKVRSYVGEQKRFDFLMTGKKELRKDNFAEAARIFIEDVLNHDLHNPVGIKLLIQALRGKQNTLKKDDSTIKKSPIPYIKKCLTKFYKNQPIDNGSGGCVYKSWDGKYVIKEIIITKETKQHDIESEKEVMARMKGYPTLMGATRFYEDVYILQLEMPLMPDGSLDDYLKKTIPLEDQYWLIMHIIYGLLCMHEKNTVHRDIKPANIFLDLKNKIAKLGDYGKSRFEISENTIPQLTGTKGYVDLGFYNACKGENENVPPELKLFTKECDIFSLGIVLAEIIIGPDFQDTLDVLRNYVECPTQNFFQKAKKALKEIKFPSTISQTLRDFLRTLLDEDRNKRPDIVKIYETFANHKDEFEEGEFGFGVMGENVLIDVEIDMEGLSDNPF